MIAQARYESPPIHVPTRSLAFLDQQLTYGNHYCDLLSLERGHRKIQPQARGV